MGAKNTEVKTYEHYKNLEVDDILNYFKNLDIVMEDYKYSSNDAVLFTEDCIYVIEYKFRETKYIDVLYEKKKHIDLKNKIKELKYLYNKKVELLYFNSFIEEGKKVNYVWNISKLDKKENYSFIDCGEKHIKYDEHIELRQNNPYTVFEMVKLNNKNTVEMYVNGANNKVLKKSFYLPFTLALKTIR